jgi:hypothetical protein
MAHQKIAFKDLILLNNQDIHIEAKKIITENLFNLRE